MKPQTTIKYIRDFRTRTQLTVSTFDLHVNYRKIRRLRDTNNAKIRESNGKSCFEDRNLPLELSRLHEQWRLVENYLET